MIRKRIRIRIQISVTRVSLFTYTVTFMFTGKVQKFINTKKQKKKKEVKNQSSLQLFPIAFQELTAVGNLL